MATVVAVEGNIAAGKSTLIPELKRVLEERGLTVFVVPEQIDAWLASGVFQRFTANPKDMAVPFQMFVTATRFMAMQACQYLNVDIILTERGPGSEKLFASLHERRGNGSADAWVAYRAHWDVLHTPVDVEIFVDVPAEEALRRCRRRNRPGEEHYDLAYFQELEEAHQAMRAVDSIVVDGSQDPKDMARQVADQIAGGQ